MDKKSVIGAYTGMAIAMSSIPRDEALMVAALAGARIAGSIHSCIILKNKKGEMKIKAGVPLGVHGIGTIVAGEGEKHLQTIMEGRESVFINNPIADPRTAYMREFVRNHSITAIYFVPLLGKKEVLGVMAFDFVARKKKYLNDAVSVSQFLAREIEALRHAKREREKEELKQRLTLMGEHSAKIAHIIRNALMIIVGLLRRLKDSASLSEHDATNALVIFNAMESLDRRVNQALAFAKFSPEHLNPKPEKINEVLTTLVENERIWRPNMHIHFERGREDTELLINRSWIENCIDDLILNAKDAGARNIWIATAKVYREERFIIAVRNDGEPIDLKKINAKNLSEIFDPFVTTKENGFGLGLSIVQSMIQSHGGGISVESIVGCITPESTHTMFIISLPL